MDLEALNMGMIASFYYVTYTTIELFASSLTAKTKLRVGFGITISNVVNFPNVQAYGLTTIRNLPINGEHILLGKHTMSSIQMRAGHAKLGKTNQSGAYEVTSTRIQSRVHERTKARTSLNPSTLSMHPCSPVNTLISPQQAPCLAVVAMQPSILDPRSP